MPLLANSSETDMATTRNRRRRRNRRSRPRPCLLPTKRKGKKAELFLLQSAPDSHRRACFLRRRRRHPSFWATCVTPIPLSLLGRVGRSRRGGERRLRVRIEANFLGPLAGGGGGGRASFLSIVLWCEGGCPLGKRSLRLCSVIRPEEEGGLCVLLLVFEATQQPWQVGHYGQFGIFLDNFSGPHLSDILFGIHGHCMSEIASHNAIRYSGA